MLTADRFKGTEFIGIPLIKTATSLLYNSFPAPESLVTRSVQALAAFDRIVHKGVFVTVSTCSGTSERARELRAALSRIVLRTWKERLLLR